MINTLQYFIQKIPIDLGQESFHHKTKGKRIALALVPKISNTNTKNIQSTALDIGTNDGYYSQILSKYGYAVTSIDIEKKYESSLIIDANKPLPYPNNSFDMIWSSEVIEHLENPQAMIQETRRLLKPEGIAIFTTPNSHFWLYSILWIFFRITPKQAQNQPHISFFGIDDIRKFNPECVYGFFPYLIVKFKISRLLNLLTPTFIFVIKKNKKC